ncbi:unnamed protein product [Calypogeia fissa]
MIKQVFKSAMMETFDAAVASIPPESHLVRQLHLKSKLSRRNGDVTICTQCSLDRLERLEAQTKAWSGVICAAVMCPCPCGPESLRDAKHCILALHGRVEAKGGPCRLDIVLVAHEQKKNSKDFPCEEPWRYPINSLRNVALQSAATELVIVLDVDFLPGFGIQEQLRKVDVYSGYLRACTELRRVIILPALEEAPDPEDNNPDSRPWEKDHLQSAFQIVSGSKASVENLWARGKLRTFAVDKYPRGHAPTDTDRWISSAATYEVQYEVDYEPYFLCSRRLVPWYDERFTGYGKNKVIHVFHTAVLDFRFWVHPEWYVIHVYHEGSRAWQATLGSDPHASKRLSDVKRLYAVAKHQLLSLPTHSGVHLPTNPCACTASKASVPSTTWLPWKKGHDMPREKEPMGHWNQADQPSSVLLQTSTKKYVQALYDLRHHFCVSKLQPVAVHRSKLKPNFKDISLVTVATPDRLQRLVAQCWRWKGVVCAAVYAPPNSDVKDLGRQVMELHQEIEKAGRCRLDIILMELAKDEKSKCIGRRAASSFDLCPINGLRNAALKLATTDLVLILDVDLLPAASLNDCFLDEQQYKCLWRMAVEERTAVVIPSFEYADANVEEYPAAKTAKKSISGFDMGKEKSAENDYALQEVSHISDTQEMTEQGVQTICNGLDSGSLRGFHVNHYPAGHNPTDFEKWRELSDSSNDGERPCCEVCRSYNIKFSEGFEPFVICSRKLIPNFDERFRGYGFDKVTFFYHLHQSGFGFRVLVHSFALDVPHPKSQDWMKTFGPTADPLQHTRVKALYQRAKREIRILTGGSALANYVVEEMPIHLVGSAKAAAGLFSRSNKKFRSVSLERHNRSTLEGLQLVWQGTIRRQDENHIPSPEFHEEEKSSSLPTTCPEEMISMGSEISEFSQKDLAAAAKGRPSCFGWSKSGAHGDGSFASSEPKSFQSMDWVRTLEEFDWDSAGWELKCKADSLSNCSVVKAPDPISEKEWFQPGGYWLRISMSAGSWSPQASRSVGITTGGVSVRSVLPIRAVKQVVVRYMVRFPSSFEWVKGGTLPGVWVDNVVQGNFGWRSGGEGHLSTALIGLSRTESEKRQPSLTKKTSKLSRPFYFVPEQWHALQLIVAVVDRKGPSEPDRSGDESNNQVVSNSHTLGIGSIRDGAVVDLRAFVDFELVSTIRYPHQGGGGSPNVTTTSPGPGPGTSMGLFLSCFFGGKTQDWAATDDTHIDFSQFEIWTD